MAFFLRSLASASSRLLASPSSYQRSYCNRAITLKNEEEDFDEFKSSLDEATLKRLESYMAEYELFKYADSRMPSKMAVKNWRRLLLMDSKVERIHHLTYLWDVEKEKAKEKMEKMTSNAEADQRVEKIRADIKQQKQEHIYYGIGGSCLFRRTLDSDMNKNLNYRLAHAMIHGPHLVFDMSFLPMMSPMEVSLTAKQLTLVHHENRAHRYPHHILFTGCRRGHVSWEDVERYFPQGIDHGMCTVTEKHYLDLFPREQLVYLSPDAKLAVNEYDAEKTYIIAACVDRMAKPNLTLGRAKEEGIDAKRLPLDRCVRLIGTKSLCLNHVVGIMNDANAYGSITAAILTNMPRRKVVPRGNDGSKLKRELNKQRLNYLRTVGKTG